VGQVDPLPGRQVAPRNSGNKIMNNTNTGGPAFPTTEVAMMRSLQGMTLRDYFAAKAMEADMIAGIHENDFAWIAARSYKMADAMLKARDA
jgi:hypothetical protein